MLAPPSSAREPPSGPPRRHSGVNHLPAAYQPNDQLPLQRCDEGDGVLVLQDALRDEGYEIDVDGMFGPGTEAAVFDYQSSVGIASDGLVGPNTWKWLTSGRQMPGRDRNDDGMVSPDEFDN